MSPRGDSYYWEGLNKGKKSIAVDFARPEGRQLVADLITAPGADAGILVTNFPQDGFLAHEPLARKRPDLISVRVMGWRDGGPGVDYTVNAALGIPYMTGGEENGDSPVNHVLPAWDLLTGAYAAFATLAAERDRLRTGRGHEVTLALSDVALAALGNTGQIGEVLTTGDRPRYGNALFGAFGRDFMTADDERVMVVAITPRQWIGLVAALSLEEPIAQLESQLGVSFARDEGQRFIHRDALFPLIERAIAGRPLEQVGQKFATHGVCWSLYSTLGQSLQADPRLSLATAMFEEMQHPSGARYPAPGAAASFAGLSRDPGAPAPRLGEHTEEVLGRLLGFDSSRVRALCDSGLVAAS